DVVGVASVGDVDVQRDAGLGDEGLEDVPGHRGVVVAADHRGHARGVGVHQVGPARDVDGDLGERLVQGDRDVGETADPGLVAQGLAEGGAEGEGGVLHRVVGVDVQVAFGVHGQVEQSVLGDLVEHVVVEADAGGDVGGA